MFRRLYFMHVFCIFFQTLYKNDTVEGIWAVCYIKNRKNEIRAKVNAQKWRDLWKKSDWELSDPA